MLNSFIRISIQRPGLVVFATVLIALAGIYSFQNLPIDAVPDITNNQVQINTSIEGLAPEEIERTVTFPIETALRGIAGVEHIRSLTRFGLSQVTVIFKDTVDIFQARQLVNERLQRVSSSLPSSSKTEMGPISTGLGEIYQYVVDFRHRATGEERVHQLMELKTIHDWQIKPRLLTIEGVAEINTSGGYEKQYHVQPDPAKMARYGIHFEEIKDALIRVNRNVGGGYIEQTAEQFLVQGTGLFKAAKEIERLPIKALESFKNVTIRDVATVTLGHQLRTGAATYNGEEAVLGTVMMLMGENSRTVALRVHEKMDEIQRQLPKEIDLIPVYNRSSLVNQTLSTVEHNLLTGALLVTLILLILLGNVRAALITAFTIPFSLLTTFVIMKPLGLSGNLMSLGALDFGIIVDGTVIVLDNCVRVIHSRSQNLRRFLNRDEVATAVYDATVEIRSAAGFGQLIIIMAFLPVFALTGVEGKMFIPMASTFAIAVLSAFVLSFTTAPALACLLLSGKAKDTEPKLMQWFRRIYIPTFELAHYFGRTTLFAAVFAVIIGAVLFFHRGTDFLPQLNEGSFAFHMIRPVNANLTLSIEMQKKADQILKTFPEVSHVFSRIGTSDVATDPMGVNVSDAYIILKPRAEWPPIEGHPRTYQDLTAALVATLNDKLPGQSYLASQPIQMRFNELLEGTRADVAIKVFGPELPQLMDFAKDIQAIAQTIPGAGDVEVDLAGTSPVLRIEPNEAKILAMNASTSDLLNSVAIAIGGEEAGYLYESDRRFPIVVRLNNEMRSNLTLIKNLPIGVAPNTLVPLKELADIDFKESYASITREDSLRRSAVMVNLRGRDTASFVNEAKSRIEKEIRLPDGYYLEWSGNFKNLEQARSRLMILVPIALLLILMMIFAAFGSVLQTLLIFACVPFALIGGVVGLIIFDLPFSLSAGIGFIALSGIAVLNGVVLVNYFNLLKSQGYTGKHLVLEGTRVRLRPVLMTALVAIFGFVPMVLSSGVGAEVQKPLASVVIGGIISSTLLTLIVLPVAFAYFETYRTRLGPTKKSPKGNH